MGHKWILGLMALAAAHAAPIDLSKLDKDIFDRLQAKASESVNLTLNSDVISVGLKFLSDQDADTAKIKKLVAGIKSISVRSFTFDKKGEYSAADVQTIRDQLKGPEWSRMVDTHSKQDGENAEIYLTTGSGGGSGGLLIISAEAKELTVVHIVGSIDLKDLDTLDEMDLGLPSLGKGHGAEKGSKDKDK